MTTSAHAAEQALLPCHINAEAMREYFIRANFTRAASEEEFKIYSAYEAILGRPEGKIRPNKRAEREAPDNADDELVRHLRSVPLVMRLLSE